LLAETTIPFFDLKGCDAPIRLIRVMIIIDKITTKYVRKQVENNPALFVFILKTNIFYLDFITLKLNPKFNILVLIFN